MFSCFRKRSLNVFSAIQIILKGMDVNIFAQNVFNDDKMVKR